MLDLKKWTDLGHRLHVAADETNDSHDHDELHAAAIICLWRGMGENMYNDYVDRWIDGLVQGLDKPTSN